MKLDRDNYYVNAVSWSHSQDQAAARSRNIAWIIAVVAIFIAFIEAIALAGLAPLKSTRVIPVLVDRQTGYVQPLDESGKMALHPDAALLRSLLAQYVESREGFNITTLVHDYRKVMLWSSGAARTDYAHLMPARNPASPIRLYPRNSLVDVTIESVSDLSPTTALVRFSTVQHDASGGEGAQSYYIAVINYHFDTQALSAEDRLINPLGFEVSGYQRSSETLSQGGPATQVPSLPAGAPAAPSGITQSPATNPDAQLPAAAPPPVPHTSLEGTAFEPVHRPPPSTAGSARGYP